MKRQNLHGAFAICFLSGERTDAYAELQNAEETASKMFFGKQCGQFCRESRQ